MEGNLDLIEGTRTATVEFDPALVDAGAGLTVTVRVTSADDIDLSGEPVIIRDAAGAAVASGALSDTNIPEGEAYVYLGEVRFNAPLTTGPARYTAVLPEAAGDGFHYAELVLPFSVTILAHAAEMNVWDLPSAIAAGEPFPLKAGIRCSCGCDLSGRPVSIIDHAGKTVAAAVLGSAPWPGTAALYFADLTVAAAPASPGQSEWTVETPAFTAAGKPHAPGRLAFGVHTVPPPDAEVTVEAFDRAKQAPIKGIHVLLHPYRALTDENGIARVKVARGRYRLVVSGFRYVPYENIIEAEGAVTERAELDVEPQGDGYFVP